MVVHEKIDCLFGVSQLGELDICLVFLSIVSESHIHTFLYLGHEMCHINSAKRDFLTLLVFVYGMSRVSNKSLLLLTLKTGLMRWL